jgi:hypothetical protein
MYWADVRGFSNTRHVSVAHVMVLTVAFDFVTFICSQIKS